MTGFRGNDADALPAGRPRRFWLYKLDSRERTTLVGTFAGWMLDGLDVSVYSFVLPTLILLWHISRQEGGALATSALLLSSLGGWLAGLAADRYGRVRVLQITIVWFATFTFLSGFTTGFSSLLIIRALQGLGFGGEWAVGSVLIGETVRAEFRGRAVGVVQGGWSFGWGLAALCYTLFFWLMPAALAWRAMFWIGLLPAVMAVWVRRHVREPELYVRQRRREKDSLSGSFKIFAPAHLRTTLLASLVALGAQGGYYSVNTFLPLYLNSRGLSVTHTGGYLAVVIAGSFCGYIASAHLTDSLGRRATLMLFAVLSLLSIGAYMAVPLGPRMTLLLGFPLGAFPSGTFSPMGAFFTELFPTSLRGSGQGFSYNAGRGVGALFPLLVGRFSAHMRLGTAIASFSLLAYLLLIFGVMLLPETRGKSLTLADGPTGSRG